MLTLGRCQLELTTNPGPGQLRTPYKGPLNRARSRYVVVTMREERIGDGTRLPSRSRTAPLCSAEHTIQLGADPMDPIAPTALSAGEARLPTWPGGLLRPATPGLRLIPGGRRRPRRRVPARRVARG